MNISGVVVACLPKHLDAVTQAVQALPWAQVHHRDEKGRLVVTIEAESGDEGAARLRVLQQLEHVAVASMAESVTLDDDD